MNPLGVSETSGEAPRMKTLWPPFLAGLPLASLVPILVYAWGDWDVLAVAALVAVGAYVAGGLLGFLFGIPRSLAGPESAEDRTTARDATTARGVYGPNTNLEQISDWLTKILVGVGLVQFTVLARHLGDLVDFLGPGLGGDPLGKTFAAATLVVFSVSGYLAFYLGTRIYLPLAFAYADQQAADLAASKRVAAKQATEQLTSAALASSKGVRAAAVDVKEIAATVDRAVEVATRRMPEILWVDDRPQNNVRERSALESLGMHVMIALSTDEALERLKLTHYDVVISDMGRPPDAQAGYTLLAEMRAAGYSAPVIIYAGSGDPEHKKLAKERGAFGSTNGPRELVDLVVQAIESQN
jgi:CheY-like chemotaxis protein